MIRHLPLLLACCTAAAACRPKVPEHPRPLATPQSLVAALRSRQAQVWSLRGETRMDSMGPEGRVKVTVNVAILRPGRLRLEAENPISGHSEGTLITDGSRFQFLDVQHQRFLQGPALPCNVARLTRVAMAPDDLALILLGSVPILPFHHAEVRPDPKRQDIETLILSLHGGGTERIAISPRTHDVIEAEYLDAHGAAVWRILHEDVHEFRGARLPRKIRLHDLRSRADIIIRMKDIEINVAIPADIFSLAPPAGMPVQAVQCDVAETQPGPHSQP
jgi:outer membrane lipoprotein-sorting protein